MLSLVHKAQDVLRQVLFHTLHVHIIIVLGTWGLEMQGKEVAVCKCEKL